MTDTRPKLAKLAELAYPPDMPLSPLAIVRELEKQPPRVLHEVLDHLNARGHLRVRLDEAAAEGRRQGFERGFAFGRASVLDPAYRSNGWDYEPPVRAGRSAEAEAFLFRVLGDGQEVEAAEMYRLAEAEGIAARTLERVRPKIVQTAPRVRDGRRASYWRLRSAPQWSGPRGLGGF